MINFFKKAFHDMKLSACEQFKVDKANFYAAKAEAKAQFEEVNANSRPENMKKAIREKQNAKIAEAEKIIAEAEQRIDSARDNY